MNEKCSQSVSVVAPFDLKYAADIVWLLHLIVVIVHLLDLVDMGIV